MDSHNNVLLLIYILFNNHNYEILYSAENPESLIRRRCGKEQVGTSQVERSSSKNQEEFLSFQYFKLEANFENCLLRSKSE